MRKIGIVGAFGFDALDKTTGGQPVKTRELYKALRQEYGEKYVQTVETYEWKSHPLRMLGQLTRCICTCATIIMLPAQNGLSVFAKLLIRVKRKETKLFYDVVGGWLAEKLKDEQDLLELVKKFDGIWVETSSMKAALNELGVNNVTVVPNFKFLKPAPAYCSEYHPKPYKLCTFSRVMKEKGICDAIQAVQEANAEIGEKTFALDIYGPLDESFRAEFANLMDAAPEYIAYKGIEKPENSVSVLRQYDALLFPTHFYTEGIPGTIIDAYSAGVPIITSLWLNSGDVFWEGETGWGYAFNDSTGLKRRILRMNSEPETFFAMREKCLEKANQFAPEAAMAIIKPLLNKE